MFKRILIANRGEIAVRIIRVCRELDIETVAIYSEADRHSLHVKYADYAYLVGPAPSVQSYLTIDGILKMTKKNNAEAIHPNYDFLTKNNKFTHKYQKNKIIFINPSPKVIDQINNKIKARTL